MDTPKLPSLVTPEFVAKINAVAADIPDQDRERAFALFGGLSTMLTLSKELDVPLPTMVRVLECLSATGRAMEVYEAARREHVHAYGAPTDAELAAAALADGEVFLKVTNDAILRKPIAAQEMDRIRELGQEMRLRATKPRVPFIRATGNTVH